jgi:glutathione S-transferase
MSKPVIYHIPVCPFSQRVEILLALKGMADAYAFRVVDITKPRDPALLSKTRGTTALPVLETADGKIIKESLVILRYLEDNHPETPIAQPDPYSRAVENMLIALESDFTNAGYRFVMNRDPEKRQALADAMTAQYAKLNGFLEWHAPSGDFLFGQFGLAEAVFTPMFARFWFLDYYENYEIPGTLARVKRWHKACLAHPAAQQVSKEEIVKLYHDYAYGCGNGALPPGRSISSFNFEPHWSKRPWPSRNKWGNSPTDRELGLAA